MRLMGGTISILLLLGNAATAPAQQYVISTYAGGGPRPAPVSAWDVALTADAQGNQYIAAQNAVFRRDRNGVITRIAGNSRPGYSGDGGPATSAQLNLPWGLAVDGAGNLFIADFNNNRVRKVSPDGTITTVAGNGAAGFSGDGGPATSATLQPHSVAVDRAGNLFIADSFFGFNEGGGRVRKVSPDGIITTVAGGNVFHGDGGPAVNAQISGPDRIAVDDAGNLFIAESLFGRVRKVSPDGIITTVAGSRGDDPYPFNSTCQAGSGDGQAATSARLCLPSSIAVDTGGNLFIGEFGYHCCYDIGDPVIEDFAVRQVSPDGTITTLAQTPGLSVCNCADVGSASVAVDRAGDVFFSDSLVSRKIAPDGTLETILDNTQSLFSGDGAPAKNAQLYNPTALALDGAGNLFIADTYNNRIRKVAPDGIITTVAGSGTFGYSGDGGPATNAQLNDPTGIGVDAAGNLFIADTLNAAIRKVSPAGVITTVAGGGTDFPGNGGPATSAQLNRPDAVAVDAAGNLFVADSPQFGGGRIYRVSPRGIITTVAGGGRSYPGDGGPATSSSIYNPRSLAIDAAGNLFIAENGRIREVSPAGIITTVAGGGTAFPADGVPATSAQLNSTAVAVDSAGNVFLVEYSRARKVSSNGTITIIAGVGVCCASSGDGGPAVTARLSTAGLAVDGAGNVFISDSSAGAIRVLRPAAESVLIGAVMDAASQRPDPISPGKIVNVYGAGLGPASLIQNQPAGGQFSTELGGTTVSFNGIAAPVLYASATSVAVVVPYEVSGSTATVKVTYQGLESAAFTAAVAPSAPSLFTLNQTGAGQAAAINAVDATPNTAANPVKIGGSINLYATGGGQSASVPVTVTIGEVPAVVQYAGSADGQVAGLLQVRVQIPNGVQPGGYVPVVLKVGDRSSGPGVWIAVGGN